MSALAARITAVLREHIWYFVGNLGVPGMPDQRGYKCYCGWETHADGDREADDPHEHVAEMVAAELNLTEEVSVRVGQLSGCVMSPYDVEPHHTVIARRFVSGWSAVEPKP